MNHKHSRFVFGLTIAFAPSVYAQGLSDGLTAYLPFDGETTPQFASGSTAISTPPDINFEEGKVGQAIVLGDKPFTLPAALNFNLPVGSVAFWFRPTWSPKLLPDSPLLLGRRELFSAENFQIAYDNGKGSLIFMTGKTMPETGYQWDYGTVDNQKMKTWPAMGWHHMVITWDSANGNKALYLDGALAKAAQTNRIRSDKLGTGKTVTLGTKNAAGSYDEWAMWDRVLTEAEVSSLYQNPTESAQILRGKPQEVVVRWPVEIGIHRAPYQKTIVAPGESFKAQITLKNPGQATWKGSMRFDLLDFWEKSHGAQNKEIEIAAGASQTLDLEFLAPQQGIWKIGAKIPTDPTLFERDVASFAVWRDSATKRVENSFYGYHVNSWDSDVLAQAARLGVSWNRGHNMVQYTWWPRIQSEKGDFTWSGEKQRANVQKAGMSLLGQFFGTPYWAARDGDTPKPAPNTYPSGDKPDLKALDTYVYETVKHHPEIRFWEVWNEPEVSMFWRGSPEEFAEMSQAAINAARRADPTIKILVGGFTQSGYAWHEAAARAGAFRGADAVSYHAYYGVSQTPEELEDRVSRGVKHFSALPALSGVTKPLELWDTESGSTDTTFLRGYEHPNLPPVNKRDPLTWRDSAITAVQNAVLLQSHGVSRSFGYLWNVTSPTDYASLHALDVTNAPKPKIISRAVLQSLTDGARHMGVVKRNEGRLSAHLFETNGHTTVVWWTGRGATVKTGALQNLQILSSIDLMGNETPVSTETRISEEPSYLRSALPAARLQALLKTLPLTVLVEAEPLKEANNSSTPDVPVLPDLAPTKADFVPVDLRPYANMGLVDTKAGDNTGGWTDEGPLNDARNLKTGRQTLSGVPFDILDPQSNGGKSVITLRGIRVTPRMPLQVANIALGSQTARALYFLHTAGWGTPGDIGRYVVRYADGQTVEIPLQIPTNTNNWWAGYHAGETSRPIPFAAANSDEKQAWRYLRVWKWNNPRPAVPVASLDFISAGSDQSPVLLAVTAER